MIKRRTKYETRTPPSRVVEIGAILIIIIYNNILLSFGVRNICKRLTGI